MQVNRLGTGGLIDRTKELSFHFNGRAYKGYAGDTLASALLANGVKIVSRSFKYHRPRGIIGSGAEEPNAILQIGSGATTEPNLRATQVELYDGLHAVSTKGWPNINFDLAQINDWMSKIFGAGFYYKTFMYPARLWSFYEHMIRSSAGLGSAPAVADPDRYSHRNAHCEVLIVGAGPAGLMAALVAGRSGARVIIADEQDQFGGSLLASMQLIDGEPAPAWVAAVREQLDGMDNVTCLPRSTAFGYYESNFVGIVERCTNHLAEFSPDQIRQRMWRVRAKQVILAQGAFERPLVFSNNDRPGVMLASAVSTYVHRFATCPGKRAVIFTNNDSAYQTALDLHAAGCEVVAVVDSRHGGAAAIANRVRAAGINIHTGSVVSRVKGRKCVTAVNVVSLNGNAQPGTDKNTLTCDLLAMSGGWSPAVHLHSHAGGKNVWSDDLTGFVPGKSTQANFSVGACNGEFRLAVCLQSAVAAANDAVRACDFATRETVLPSTEYIDVNPTEALWRVPGTRPPERLPKQFVDYQNDTTVTDIRLAAREGYTSVEHVKRYTALGFGTDQGKLGNINGMAVLAETLGKPIQEVGTTTFRPAYTPVTFGAVAGDDVGTLYEPVRNTALHAWHESRQALFEVVGQWLRPWYFPREGEDLDTAVARECLATRQSVGIMDASTLGKIDVQGSDALTFLERIYTHNIAKMGIGRCAYGIMLGEDGMVKDDGVMARLGEQHFYLTTTTGGAAEVLAWLELWLQTEWPELNVYLTSLTDHYSTIAVVGPDSRSVLQTLECDMDLSKESFPFMAVRSGTLAGIPVQLFRVSFSGELAFEINVDSNHAAAMWNAVMDAGADFSITPYGTETMHVLRAEKGFVIVGQDTDGSVTPVDLGMNWMLSKDKDYLGKRSLARSEIQQPGRKQLVGLLSEDGATVVAEGAQLVSTVTGQTPVPMDGHVTSSYDSPSLGHPIALALLRSGRNRHGEVIFAIDSTGRKTPVRVVSPVFYDSKGERQRV